VAAVYLLGKLLFDKVLAGLTEATAEAARALSSRNARPEAPQLFLAAALASTALAANDLFPALVDMPLAIYLIVRNEFKKTLLTLLFFDVVVSTSLLFSQPFRALDFVIRSFSYSSVFIFLTSLTGWNGFVSSLPVPAKIKFMIKVIPVQTYLSLKELNSLVLARKARPWPP